MFDNRQMNWSQVVTDIDEWLDSAVSPAYHAEPLAQHWARVAKITEEVGEAIANLILWTGQNPRKTADPDQAYNDLLDELGDCVITGMLALQHFTKDVSLTEARVLHRLAKTHVRMLASVRRAHELGL